MSNSSSNSSGLSLAGVLTVVFVVLKLVGVITWKWIWVLSPLWIGFAFWFLIIFLILGVLMGLRK